MHKTLNRPATLNIRPKWILAIIFILCLIAFFASYTPQKGNIQSAKDVPLPSAVVGGVKDVGLQPVTQSTRELMISMFRETYHWDSYGYEVVDTAVGWESVQQAYDGELRDMGFKQDAHVDSAYAFSWSRSRFFGLEGEQVVLIWENESADPQTYFIHFGLDR